jgi:hypothetical protein
MAVRFLEERQQHESECMSVNSICKNPDDVNYKLVATVLPIVVFCAEFSDNMQTFGLSRNSEEPATEPIWL